MFFKFNTLGKYACSVSVIHDTIDTALKTYNTIDISSTKLICKEFMQILKLIITTFRIMIIHKPKLRLVALALLLNKGQDPLFYHDYGHKEFPAISEFFIPQKLVGSE